MELRSSQWRYRASLICLTLLLTTLTNALPLLPRQTANIFENSDNIAVYWGQNSYQSSSPPQAQKRLVDYCRDTTVDIFPLAFLTNIANPAINFANQAASCPLFPGTQLAHCPTLGEDIKTCQQVYGKKILLSIGGATYGEGGFTSTAQAVSAARRIFDMFAAPPGSTNNVTTPQWNQTAERRAQSTELDLNQSAHGGWQDASSAKTRRDLPLQNSTANATFPGEQRGAMLTAAVRQRRRSLTGTPESELAARSTAPLRPFDDAVVDGFDLDIESPVPYMDSFAKALRTLMDADTSKQYYLTAAPTCPQVDTADNPLLYGNTHLDAVFVQFYNSPCGLDSFTAGASRQLAFNFADWNAWALPRQTKVFLGVPAGQSAASTGYLSAAELKPIIQYSQKFASFGGVMMWDASQASANIGFLSGVRASLSSTTSRRWTNR